MWAVHLALGLIALYTATIAGMHFAQTWLLFPTALARNARLQSPACSTPASVWLSSSARNRRWPSRFAAHQADNAGRNWRSGSGSPPQGLKIFELHLAAKLAAAETELACLKLALAQVKEDRNELRQERDDWRREAEMLCAEKLIAAKLRLAGERRFAPPERRPWCVSWRAKAPGATTACDVSPPFRSA
jgi:hypothetical protein